MAVITLALVPPILYGAGGMKWSKEKQNEYWKRVKDKYNAQKRERWRSDPEYRSDHRRRNREKYFREHGKFPKEIGELSTRFRVFLRDRFTCVYCGRKPPDVQLQIDHVIPKARGGDNTAQNLVTSCRECNIGKGDYILNN